MARWLKTKAPHNIRDHIDVVDDIPEDKTILRWNGTLGKYENKKFVEIFELKQIEKEVVNAGEFLAINLENPNPNKDRYIEILLYDDTTTQTKILYDFTFSESDKFNKNNRFFIFDNYAKLKKSENFEMVTERFFWTTTINVDDYHDTDTFLVIVED